MCGRYCRRPSGGYTGREDALHRAEAHGRAQPQTRLPGDELHGLLLQRAGIKNEQRRHDGRVAVDVRNTRWCLDDLEIACDNGDKVRVAFALDCCDREAICRDHRRDQRRRCSWCSVSNTASGQ